MKLIRSVATVSGLTGISRIFGLLREILMSHFLGAGSIADAFIVAFKFPNFFRRFFAEGAFNAAFVPEFAGTLAKNGKDQAYNLANQVFTWMTIFLSVFVILVVAFAPKVMCVIAPGFFKTPDRLHYAIQFTRITFPYILCISLAAIFSGILNSLDKYAAAAGAPIILNIAMILSLFIMDTDRGFYLSTSVVIAGIIQMLWLHYILAKNGFLLKLQKPRLSKSLKRIMHLMLPGAIGAGVMQINIFVDMMLASTLSTGSLAYLYYADRINQLPLSIFGVAIGTVLLPNLSKAIRNGESQKAYILQEKSLTLGLKLSIPSAVGLIVLSLPIIDVIYGHGSFTSIDIAMTAPTLSAFAVGLPAYVVSKVFTSCFFASQDTKTPLKIGVVTVLINFSLNIILINYFEHVGLALSTGISAWFQVILLACTLYIRKMIKFSKILIIEVMHVFLASIAMALAVKKINTYSNNFIREGFVAELIILIIIASVGVLIYFFFLKILSLLRTIINKKVIKY